VAKPVELVGTTLPAEAASNVYDLSFASNGGAVALRPAGEDPTITLRAYDASSPFRVMEHRVMKGGQWRQLSTRKVGTERFTASISGPGEYALVREPSSAAGGSSSTKRTLLIVGIVLGLVIFTLAILRARASGE
jgi:hypothetical protein